MASAQVLGRYVGIDAAEGMRITVEGSEAQARGTLRRADGSSIAFTGEIVEDVLEAAFSEGGERIYMRLLAEPIGARVVMIPFDGENQLRVDRTAAYAFLREGVSLPQRPTRFMPPPERPVRAMDARAFVSSFPFWPPLSVALGYEGVAPRHRTLIKLYPIVQADLLWKLCASPERTGGIAEALRGQGVTCQEVAQAFRQMQRSGSFDRFKRSVAEESRLLMTALLCADDLTRSEARCRDVASETARRAVSMDTVATVLARYR